MTPLDPCYYGGTLSGDFGTIYGAGDSGGSYYYGGDGSSSFGVGNSYVENGGGGGGGSTATPYPNQTNAKQNTWPFAQQEVSSCGVAATRVVQALLLGKPSLASSEADLAAIMTKAADAYLKTLDPNNSFDISRFSTLPQDGKSGIGGQTATVAFNAVFNPMGCTVTNPILSDSSAVRATLTNGSLFIVGTTALDLNSSLPPQGHFVVLQYNSSSGNFTLYDSGNIQNGVGTITNNVSLETAVGIPTSSPSGATGNIWIISPTPPSSPPPNPTP